VTVLTSNNRKKVARKVFIVRVKRLSAFQMKKTGMITTPRIIRRGKVMFSLRLDIYINSGTRYKAQGIRHKERR
jgi:hypothetical protein